VNVLTLVTQIFLTGRILRWFGVGMALALLPAMTMLGFGLLAAQGRFRSFALRPGIDLVMEATDFPARLSRADLVITGEGRIDAQTAFGKTALGVAKRAAAAGVPCIAVGGGVEVDGIRALAEVGATAVPVVERPISVEEAMTAGVDPLVRCGERLARLVSTW